MQASLTFSCSEIYTPCSISRDIYLEYSNKNESLYGTIELPTYGPTRESKKLVQCVLDNALPFCSVVVPSKLFGFVPTQPTLDFCYFETVQRDKIPILDSVTLMINDQLYSKLMNLPHEIQQRQFLHYKYGISSMETIIHAQDILTSALCQVLNCSPFSQGFVDFNETELILVKDVDQKLSTNKYVNEDNGYAPPKIGTNSTLSVKLKSLPHIISKELLRPKPHAIDDDSIHAFTDAKTLLRLDVTSASFIKLSHMGCSRLVKLFVFLLPNNFEENSIYVPPKIMASFLDCQTVTISKPNIGYSDIPIANQVFISRVGGWLQSQKCFQNIILITLKKFFRDSKRILCKGDLIPIAFDSSMAALEYDDESSDGDAVTQYYENDSLVWFIVTSAEVETASKENDHFIIDPHRTKLVTTNIVNKRPLPLSRCNLQKYYGFSEVFHYDMHTFPYVGQLINILETSFDCSQRGIPLNASVLLYSTTSSVGKATMVRFASKYLGVHLLEIDCLSLTSNLRQLDSTSKIIGYIRAKWENVLPYTSPAIIFLAHLDSILLDVNVNQDPEAMKLQKSINFEMSKLLDDLTSNFPGTTFIGSVSNIDNVPSSFRSHMRFEILVPVPSELQRLRVFEWYLSSSELNKGVKQNIPLCYADDVSFLSLSSHSAGLTPLDVKAIVETARMMATNRFYLEFKKSGWYPYSILITQEDLSSAISKARDEFSASIGAPRIPNVTWDDIGGIDFVKGEVMDTIDMPLKHPELFTSGMKKRSGILFYGPPGTGKTLMAKAIATSFSLNFFSVKGPELLNMYIGESEANVRRVFQKAREAKPCVIFFDEIDSVAPKRGNQGDSGGVMDRIVSQLLAELDGMSTDADGVFVIGATNRPDLLDEALLRPGRFDKLLYLGIPDTDDKQLNILEALTRKFVLDRDVKLTELAKLCPFNYTGADFYALCSDAMLNAMSRIARIVETKVSRHNETTGENISTRRWFDKIATKDDTKVVVKMEDFLKAQEQLSPSVSQAELDHYQRVRANFEGV
ncbi:pex6p [Saccharomyces arboricola H-6]|uniref:Peroxisomal ATPase PEX6 n=1 Tax=Saccharomyces arboricola (strain H-6 / AS 2.3317 / CBS 10644) TaxID=1160507 RepID=J8Q0D6_SACAR|nr:pex6p [Saccharomyces arboricola H-6]